MNSFVLDIVLFEHPHTAERIALLIYGIICEWGIQGRVQCLTVDNGPNIAKAARILTGLIISEVNIPREHMIPYFMRCAGHTIQKIAEVGLLNSQFTYKQNTVSINLLTRKIRYNNS